MTGAMPSALAGVAPAKMTHARTNAPSASSQFGLALFEKGIVEAIVIVIGLDPAAHGSVRLECCHARLGVPGKKRVHRGFVFFPEDRAGRVEQFTTTLKDLPHSIEEGSLLGRESGDIR